MEAPGQWRRCGDRDEGEAFAALYQRYAGDLFRFCLSRTRNRTLAEEALATIFLEAWRRRGEVNLTSEPEAPWLYGVARNVLRNQHRKQQRHRAAVHELEQLHQHHADDPSEVLERRQQADALVDSLIALPDGQRAVVNLCILGDRSYEAAAGTLKIPVGTVRSRLSRARLTLALAVRTASGN